MSTSVVSMDRFRAYDVAAERLQAVAVRPINVQLRRFIGVAELVGRLGLGDLASRTAIKRLRLLHDQGGLPAPRTPRFVHGKLITGARAIDARSQWDRAQILEWLETGYVTANTEGARRNDQLRATLNARAIAGLPHMKVAR